MNTQQLIEENLDLVKYRSLEAAKRYGDEYGEYMTSGYLGLCEAAERFDPAHGVKFRSFAQRRVDGAIIDQFRRDHGRRGGGRYAMHSRVYSIDALKETQDRVHPDDFSTEEPFNSVDERDQIDSLKKSLCPHNEYVGTIIEGLADGKTLKQAGLAIGKSESLAHLCVKHVVRPLMSDWLMRRK